MNIRILLAYTVVLQAIVHVIHPIISYSGGRYCQRVNVKTISKSVSYMNVESAPQVIFTLIMTAVPLASPSTSTGNNRRW